MSSEYVKRLVKKIDIEVGNSRATRAELAKITPSINRAATLNPIETDFLISRDKKTQYNFCGHIHLYRISYGSSYETHDLQGMNYPRNSYISSRPPELPIASEFTANNIDEARYMLAIFQFLKVLGIIKLLQLI